MPTSACILARLATGSRSIRLLPHALQRQIQPLIGVGVGKDCLRPTIVEPPAGALYAVRLGDALNLAQ
jgi:hypothetical protein